MPEEEESVPYKIEEEKKMKTISGSSANLALVLA